MQERFVVAMFGGMWFQIWAAAAHVLFLFLQSLFCMFPGESSLEETLFTTLRETNAKKGIKWSDEDSAFQEILASANMDMDEVTIFRTMSSFKDRLKEVPVSSKGRPLVFADFPTSKMKVLASYLDECKSFLAPWQSWSLIIHVGPRLQVLSTAASKVTELWPDLQHWAIQLNAGTHQTSARPNYCIYLERGAASSTAIPTFVKCLRLRSPVPEGLGKTCGDTNCPHNRSEEDKFADDAEVDLFDPQADEADEDDAMEEVAIEQLHSSSGKRGKAVPLWPFSYNSKFYSAIFQEVGRIESVLCVLYLGSSAHPSALVAARSFNKLTLALLDRPSEHSCFLAYCG